MAGFPPQDPGEARRAGGFLLDERRVSTRHGCRLMRATDLLEILRMAVNALTRSPARSGLTILGLAIGIAAFIAMTSFGQGAKGSVVAQFAGLGTNIVRMRTLVNDPAAGPRAARPLTAMDVRELRRNLTTARRVVGAAAEGAWAGYDAGAGDDSGGSMGADNRSCSENDSREFSLIIRGGS